MAIQNQTAGIEFPIKLISGSSSLTTGLDIIKSSIKIILSWPLRTRYFNGDFGSRLEEAIESPNDDLLKTLVRRFILDSIEQWERRVELISVDINRSTPEKLDVNLVYKVKELDIQDSLFYDFYIN